MKPEEFVAETAIKVHKKMKGLVDDDSLDSMRDILNYANDKEAKRLRPSFCRLGCMAATDDISSQDVSLDLAAACELLHQGSIMLDDCVDLQRLRRGKLSVPEVFGIADGATGAFKMTVLAFKIGIKKVPKAVEMMMTAVSRMLDGQAMENRIGLNKNRYYKCIELKTATLFEYAAMLGAYIGNADYACMESVRGWGKNAGMAFQVMDDLVDIRNSVNLGIPKDDLITHKVTLPIILLSKLPEIHDDARDIINSYADGTISDEDLKTLIDYLDENNTIEDSMNIVDKYLDASTLALQPIRDCEAKDIMLQLPIYAIDTLKKEIL